MLENSDHGISLFVWNINININIIIILNQWKKLEFMQGHNFVFRIYMVIKSPKFGSCIYFMHNLIFITISPLMLHLLQLN